MTTPSGNTKTETLACLIIDDPLLTPRYGCLEYKTILMEMKEHGFFTEIAFIPWNYKRSDPGTVRLLADNPDHFAICVHGCDHSGNEFGGGDYHRLSSLASTALWRMEQHRRFTGLPFDPVMVFPQGHFSSVAMQALRDHGYFAAFNSTIRATDSGEPVAVELQRPFTAVYHDLPLFLRRYPKDRSSFAQDMASGRPIIIVEHPGAFREGYKAMTDLIDWVNSLGKIRWTSLLNIAEHYTRKKAVSHASNVHPTCAEQDRNPRVALRRYLSEIRDNYVETSASLNRFYRMLRGQ